MDAVRAACTLCKVRRNCDVVAPPTPCTRSVCSCSCQTLSKPTRTTTRPSPWPITVGTPRSPMTSDLITHSTGAQAVVTWVLQQRFPDIAMVAEEDAAALRANNAMRARVAQLVNEVLTEHTGRTPNLSVDAVLDLIDCGGSQGGASGRHWVLDPIDGTRGFVSMRQYAVCLGLLAEGEACGWVCVIHASKGGCEQCLTSRCCWLQSCHTILSNTHVPLHLVIQTNDHALDVCHETTPGGAGRAGLPQPLH